METSKLIEFKKNLRVSVFNIYNSNGLEHAVNSINNLVKNSNKKSNEIGDKELPIIIRGECCELLLELQIIDYAKQRNLPWIVSKGLSIMRQDNKRNKTTELDITLFTPSKIVLFESKYRSGKMRILEECTLIPEWGHHINVYKQNLMHVDNLRRYLDSAVIDITRGKPFSICLYVDSISRVTDCRETCKKGMVPLVGSENIIAYLDNLTRNKVEIWNMQELYRIVKELNSKSDEVFTQHMKGVKR